LVLVDRTAESDVSGGVKVCQTGAAVREGNPALSSSTVTPSSRRAVVVGAGSGNGIGRESALALAATGADVVCADRDLPAAGETARLGGGLTAYELDVGGCSRPDRAGRAAWVP